MPSTITLERIALQPNASPLNGSVHWAPVKSLWWVLMTAAGLIGIWYYWSWFNLIVFLTFTALTLLGGHSLGMHRRLIHNSYACPRWLEYSLVYLGVLVGLAGPYGMIRTHDQRDWAQRHADCHDYFAHRQPWWRDFFWQVHCDITLSKPVKIDLLASEHNSAFYQWLERYWMWSQLPVALLCYALGGIGLVLWAVGLRVSVSILGHWLIGYFAHRGDHAIGHREWQVTDAGVQGYNIKFLGQLASLMTMGECWHNNHHAFPGSANLGLSKGQWDPGWWALQILAKLGLVWNIRQPCNLATRHNVVNV